MSEIVFLVFPEMFTRYKAGDGAVRYMELNVSYTHHDHLT